MTSETVHANLWQSDRDLPLSSWSDRECFQLHDNASPVAVHVTTVLPCICRDQSEGAGAPDPPQGAATVPMRRSTSIDGRESGPPGEPRTGGLSTCKASVLLTSVSEAAWLVCSVIAVSNGWCCPSQEMLQQPWHRVLQAVVHTWCSLGSGFCFAEQLGLSEPECHANAAADMWPSRSRPQRLCYDLQRAVPGHHPAARSRARCCASLK